MRDLIFKKDGIIIVLRCNKTEFVFKKNGLTIQIPAKTMNEFLAFFEQEVRSEENIELLNRIREFDREQS